MTSSPNQPYPPISDYGIIGDCRSAALVSREGSIDWLCWPRFDSPSVFARILDRNRGGFFSIHPVEPFEVEREYEPETNILTTTFTTPGGRVTLTDLMPVLPSGFRKKTLAPFRGILRRIEGVTGTVAMKMEFEPRVNYGIGQQLRSRGERTIFCADRKHTLYLRGTTGISLQGSHAEAVFEVGEAETVDFSLAYSDISPSVLPPLGDAATAEIEATRNYWKDWSSRISYEGKHRDHVIRSALVLKLFCFAPSGAVIAAPTTSLPEWIGGVRNWDYRFCWLRDASFTVRALYGLGCGAEAASYVNWLLHATRLTHPRLNVVYDVYGEMHLPEHEIETLEGYRDSSPVRVGNDASGQVQIDVYGEVMIALAQYRAEGNELERSERRFARGIADWVCDHWTEPDDGIWENRSSRAQHIHGKVLCWAALRAAVLLSREGALEGDVDRWEAEMKRIREYVLDRGFNERVGSFVGVAGGDELDASSLVFSVLGFIDGDEPRMLGTIEAIRRELGRDDLVYRYRHDDGLPGDEGAFLACSFWLVDALAEAGDLEEAERLFQALLDRTSDLGLLSEEIDPRTGEFLGNFPQGLTHIALINAALQIEKARGEEGDGTLTGSSALEEAVGG